jgi:hypothetical protein
MPAQDNLTCEQLELEGHELIARGHARLADAARKRAQLTTAAGDWIRVDALPIPRRSALAACRAGDLRAVKRGRVWLTTRADADAFLARQPPASAANDDAENDVRRALGLVTRSAAR